MSPLRRFASTQRALAGALIALALAMKLLVPAGFMPSVTDKGIVIALCSGTGPTHLVVHIPGAAQDEPGDGGHGKAEQPCVFGGLSGPSLAAADPILLALAILFVLAVALRPVARPIAAEPPFLRPPLRGPPTGL